METFFSLIKILRPLNCLISGVGTLIGAWISSANLSKVQTLTLFFVTITATGFGNVINDIADIKTDKISHPTRPLPAGNISIKIAILYSATLGGIAIVAAFSVAPIFGIGTIIPLSLLILYAFILKRTPLWGNILVSLLVPYSLIFPAIGAPDFCRIFIPCLIASFLNFSREIVKTLQDEIGDKTCGLVTTAVLPRSLLKNIIFIVSIFSFLLMILQWQFHFSGAVYILLVSTVVIPLHFVNFYIVLRYNLTEKIETLSLLYKVELVSGILALTVDNFWFVNN